jgi:hypothetical protein
VVTYTNPIEKLSIDLEGRLCVTDHPGTRLWPAFSS